MGIHTSFNVCLIATLHGSVGSVLWRDNHRSDLLDSAHFVSFKSDGHVMYK